MKKNNIGTIFFIKLLISIVITLVILILIKSSSNFKNNFYKHIYSNNISFTKLKGVYNKYIGDFNIFDNVVKIETVFNEKLMYNSSEKYLDGVKLSIDSNYLVPINESGVVVFIGEKENYGNVIIIQGMDGVDIWYGNMSTTSVKLYDYIESGDLLGVTLTNNLYLVYSKDGNYLNYEEYLN